MWRGYTIQEGKIVEADAERATIHLYIAPDESERRFLIENLKIDEHTLASALDPDETPRLEFEPEHAAIIMNRPKNYSHEDQFMFKVATTGIFLFKNRLVVVIAEDVPIFDGGKPLMRVETLQDVLLKILYRSIVHFLGHLKGINAIADELEQKINTSMENRYLLNLFTLEKSLVYLTTAIHANGTLLERMRNNAAKLGFTAEGVDILDDI
ncbi:MAG: magnesium transporter CorA family protein, partial [Planctomycetota bacterium]|nr:magnesium transporter CorA family protein [Planctomycetota bacterium]